MNKILNISLLSLLILLSQNNSHAAEPPEKIHIDADQMTANILTGHSVYTGNVRVRQGQLLLTGDRITVQQHNNEVEKITVIGKPAHYNHVTESGEQIKANSERMVYTASNNRLVLTINARLNHPEHQISSQKIIYNTLTKVATAGDKSATNKSPSGDSGSSERVKITLTPKSTDSSNGNK